MGEGDGRSARGVIIHLVGYGKRFHVSYRQSLNEPNSSERSRR